MVDQLGRTIKTNYLFLGEIVMKNILITLALIIISGIAVTACGPSEEAIATMTAAAWTPTPEPTLTPTPLPFDLVVMLEGEGGEAVIMGSVEATEDDSEMVDENGKVEFFSLPTGDITLLVTAQGYETIEEPMTLEPGKNEKTIILRVDPRQVLPATACQEGQEVLFIEDFEDGMAQDWVDLTRPAWSFGETEEGGTTLSVYVPGEVGYTSYDREFGNAVWHVNVQTGSGNIDLHMNWHLFETDEGQGRYMLVYYPGRHIQLHYQIPGGGRELFGKGAPAVEPGIWQKFSIAYFNGALDVFVNDELVGGIDHDDPIESGGLGFIVTDNSEVISFDNIVVCGLTEPYVLPVVEEAAE
jgi:hypothetical protein